MLVNTRDFAYADNEGWTLANYGPTRHGYRDKVPYGRCVGVLVPTARDEKNHGM